MTDKDWTVSEIRAECAEIVVAMTEKGFVTPRCEVSIDEWKFGVALWCERDEGPQLNPSDFTLSYLDNHFGATPVEAFAAARKRIAEQPTPEQAALSEFHHKVAEAIDYGRDNNIPDEYVAPLRTSHAAMTENLLSVTK
jgi:hypothetical protein